MITPLPAVPQRSMSPAQFVAAADAFMAALPTFLAELNAMGTAYNLATSGTSATSKLIATGSFAFTTNTGLGFQPGMSVKIGSTASGQNWMYGDVTAYNSGTGAMTVNVTSVGGSGTFAAWTITLAASGTVASLTSNTFSGVQNYALGSNIASASTINLTTATGNTLHITGTTDIFAVTLGAGMWRYVIFDSALRLYYNATTNNINGSNSTGYLDIKAGDRAIYWSDGSVVYGNIIRTDGQAIAQRMNGALPTVQIVADTPAAGQLNLMLPGGGRDGVIGAIDFRNPLGVGNGAVVSYNLPAVTALVISSGSTLGTVSGVASRIAVLAINNSGTIELAVVNTAGNLVLDEKTVINVTAEGGAGAADSASTVYGNTARTGVTYRVLGFFESTQTVAGTWSTNGMWVPAGTAAASASMDGFGVGNVYRSVGGSRAIGTTYYNTDNKTRWVRLITTAATTLGNRWNVTVNGNTPMLGTPALGTNGAQEISFFVPPGGSYVVAHSVGATNPDYWYEFSVT